jgi:hypothetical protein
MSGGAYSSGVAELPLSSCPDCGGSPAVVYLARNQRTDLPWDASYQCDSCDAEWVVPLSPADILTLQQAPAGGGSLIDWGQP